MLIYQEKSLPLIWFISEADIIWEDEAVRKERDQLKSIYKYSMDMDNRVAKAKEGGGKGGCR